MTRRVVRVCGQELVLVVSTNGWVLFVWCMSVGSVFVVVVVVVVGTCAGRAMKSLRISTCGYGKSWVGGMFVVVVDTCAGRAAHEELGSHEELERLLCVVCVSYVCRMCVVCVCVCARARARARAHVCERVHMYVHTHRTFHITALTFVTTSNPYPHSHIHTST